MKRRVAVARALLIPSHILLMDEPFTGMDDELKRNVISYIREKQDGRLLILSTHQEEDVGTHWRRAGEIGKLYGRMICTIYINRAKEKRCSPWFFPWACSAFHI